MQAIITPQQILLLQQSPQLILVDARSGPEAKEKYLAMHLQGAYFVDLEQELSHKKTSAAEGGRHPLPDVHQFAQVLTKLGITPESEVVVYDDKNGANAAARFWWMLNAMGHEKVQVLSGGLQATIAAGYPTSSQEEIPTAVAPYPVKSWQLPMATLDTVEQAAADSNFLVIDVREPERYRGEKEPIDLVAGHIPGAVNVPFSTNLDPNGLFLDAEELKTKYEQILGNRPSAQVIVHCGSGVTACHTLLAMAQAGMEVPQLYVGSWSEWSRNNKTIATDV